MRICGTQSLAQISRCFPSPVSVTTVGCHIDLARNWFMLSMFLSRYGIHGMVWYTFGEPKRNARGS